MLSGSNNMWAARLNSRRRSPVMQFTASHQAPSDVGRLQRRAFRIMVIKKGYPVVQVSVYDRVASDNSPVELLLASR